MPSAKIRAMENPQASRLAQGRGGGGSTPEPIFIVMARRLVVCRPRFARTSSHIRRAERRMGRRHERIAEGDLNVIFRGGGRLASHLNEATKIFARSSSKRSNDG